MLFNEIELNKFNEKMKYLEEECTDLIQGGHIIIDEIKRIEAKLEKIEDLIICAQLNYYLGTYITKLNHCTKEMHEFEYWQERNNGTGKIYIPPNEYEKIAQKEINNAIRANERFLICQKLLKESRYRDDPTVELLFSNNENNLLSNIIWLCPILTILIIENTSIKNTDAYNIIMNNTFYINAIEEIKKFKNNGADIIQHSFNVNTQYYVKNNLEIVLNIKDKYSVDEFKLFYDSVYKAINKYIENINVDSSYILNNDSKYIKLAFGLHNYKKVSVTDELLNYLETISTDKNLLYSELIKEYLFVLQRHKNSMPDKCEYEDDKIRCISYNTKELFDFLDKIAFLLIEYTGSYDSKTKHKWDFKMLNNNNVLKKYSEHNFRMVIRYLSMLENYKNAFFPDLSDARIIRIDVTHRVTKTEQRAEDVFQKYEIIFCLILTFIVLSTTAIEIDKTERNRNEKK